MRSAKDKSGFHQQVRNANGVEDNPCGHKRSSISRRSKRVDLREKSLRKSGPRCLRCLRQGAGYGLLRTLAPGERFGTTRGSGAEVGCSYHSPSGMNSSVIYSGPVNYSRSFILRIARFVLVALLLQAMGISLAQSRGSTGAFWSEICTVNGAKWVKQVHSDDGSASEQHASSEHCVFCNVTTPLDSFDLTKHLRHQTSETPLFRTSDVEALRFAGHRIQSRAPPI